MAIMGNDKSEVIKSKILYIAKKKICTIKYFYGFAQWYLKFLH